MAKLFNTRGLIRDVFTYLFTVIWMVYLYIGVSKPITWLPFLSVITIILILYDKITFEKWTWESIANIATIIFVFLFLFYGKDSYVLLIGGFILQCIPAKFTEWLSIVSNIVKK